MGYAGGERAAWRCCKSLTCTFLGALGRIRTCNLLIRSGELVVLTGAGGSVHAYLVVVSTPTSSG